MRESLDFFYNNELSNNMGIININLEGSLYRERLFGARELIEEMIRGRSKPYFQSIELKPMEFTLAFAFSNDFNYEQIRSINRWLNVDFYKEFYFVDFPQYRFFVMPVLDNFLTHNGMNQGYMELTMRTNDAYAYSQEYLSENYDLIFNTVDGTVLTINNDGDVPLEIEMWIKKYGNGDITIINTSDNDREFRIQNLYDEEQLYLNHEKEDIQSNVPNFYHFEDVLTDYLKLPLGENNLRVYGNCTIQFRYRYKYLLGI
jgi:phage-related protein